MKHDVAIVGGGITGVLAAKKLIDHGRTVLVLDKSKSVGGRMATRRISNGRADHGAQFFTVRTSKFQQLVDEWEQNGWVSKWFGDSHVRYKSNDGMNQLVKHISQGLPVQLSSRVDRIERERDGYMILSDSEVKVRADTVLLTPPAPQTLQLLERSDVEISETVHRSLRGLTFAPALVGLVLLNPGAETRLPPTGHQDEKLPDGIERVVDSYAKGISGEHIISIYATSDLSIALYSEEDEAILITLLKRVAHLIPVEAVSSRQLKRWRYAQANQVQNSPVLNISEHESIFIAGDAFLQSDDQSGRTRIESAVLSGLASANEIHQRFNEKASL